MARVKLSDLSPALGRQALAQCGRAASPRKHKYRAKPTMVDGVRYASKAEAARAAELELLRKAGAIREWRRQVRCTLGVPENVYIVDFVVVALDGGRHAEDVKGFETSAFRRNRRLWRQYGPMPLVILKRRGRRWQREVVEHADRG